MGLESRLCFAGGLVRRPTFGWLVLVLTLPIAMGADRSAARAAFQKALAFHKSVIEKPLETRSRQEYQRAIYLYRLVLDHDPSYGGCDDALFAIASIYQEDFDRFGDPESRRQAIYYYQFLTEQYPVTRFKKAAGRRVSELSQKAPGSPAQPLPESSSPDPKSPATVTELRYWSNEKTTRVVIQTDREVEFEKNLLSNPDRIYFDLKGSRLQSGLERTYNVNGVSLQRVRLAENQPGVVRVVLDFEQIRQHSVFALYDPFRIVIDTRSPAEKPVGGAADRSETIKTAEAVISLEGAPSKREVLTETAPEPNLGGDLTLTRMLGLKIGKVALDPGHGGRDTGTVGPNGLTEKELVLDVALRLKALLEDKLGTEVTLTRESDEFVPLEERTAVANKEGADLFVSIHANASRNRKVSGIETFFLSFATDADEREVASRENATSQRNIRELEDLLKKIALGDYLDESRDLAHVVQSQLSRELQEVRPSWKNRGVKKAPFIVLINSTMPSILTEIGFLSNPADEKYLKKEEARQKVAEALFNGIQEYFRALGNAVPEVVEGVSRQ